ncbi:MAG: hypothetical protein M3015_13930 [Bacteroidota bacterium]|nr:hypothetical protein [Bacteroidota bacterium]
MKKIFFAYAVSCLFTCFVINKASAQFSTDLVSLNTGTKETLMQKYNSALPENSDKDYRNTINIHAVRKFVRDFKNAKNVVWIKANDGYVARFINDSIHITVAYDLRGSWTYTLKKYAENKMPVDVRAMVKSTYFDYAITEVTEIKIPEESENIIYRVLIKYADNFKILQIRNKEMEVVSDYTKP